MSEVLFQKPGWKEKLARGTPLGRGLIGAFMLGSLLALAFYTGNMIQAIAVAILPMIVYAMLRNTMMVFLVWIAASPILSNFVTIYLGAGIPDITVDRVAASILMMVLLFQVAMKTRRLYQMGIPELWMLAVVLLMLPAISNSSRPIHSSQQVFDNVFTPFIVFFLAKNLVVSKRELRPLIWSLGTVTLYCAVLGFYEHFTAQSLFTVSGQLTWQDVGGRIQGPFASPQILGTVMVGGIVLFTYQAFNSRKLSARLASIAIIVIHTLTTYWTYRRSVWMGYFVTVIFLSIVEKRMRNLFIIATVLGIFMLAMNWTQIVETEIFRKRVANTQTINDRYVIWLTSWEIIKSYPVFGCGFGEFGANYQEHFRFLGNRVTTHVGHGILSPHSSYVRFWVEAGPFPLLAYLTLLGVLSRRAWRILRGKVIHPFVGSMEIMVFAGLFLTQYTQAITTDVIFFTRYPEILIFLLAGVICQPVKRAPKQPRNAAFGRLRPLGS